MSLADAIASLGAVTHTVSRAGTSSYDSDGKYVPGALTTLTIQAINQPLSGRELQRLPEGLRTKETRQFYTTTELRAASVADGTVADIIEVTDVGFFQVELVEDRNPFGFYRVVGSLIQDETQLPAPGTAVTGQRVVEGDLEVTGDLTVGGTLDASAITVNGEPLSLSPAASDVTVTPSGNLASTNAQAALVELQSDIDTRATSSALTAHMADTSTHGVGEVVGTTEDQTISGKTFVGTSTRAAIDATSAQDSGFPGAFLTGAEGTATNPFGTAGLESTGGDGASGGGGGIGISARGGNYGGATVGGIGLVTEGGGNSNGSYALALEAHGNVSITNDGGGTPGTLSVAGAITTGGQAVATSAALTAHTGASSGAHAASAISNTPSGNLAATTVQAALNELQTDVDTRATSSALTTHTGASSGVHGVTGSVVGTSDTQTLSGKTFSDTIRSSVASAAVAMYIAQGARLTFDGASGTNFLSFDGSNLTWPSGFKPSSIECSTLRPAGTAGMQFTTFQSDSAGTIGFTLQVSTQTNAGAKVLRVRNNITEVSNIGYLGAYTVLGVAAGGDGVILPTQVAFKSGSCTFGSDSTGNSAQISVASSSNNLTAFCQVQISGARTRSVLNVAAAGKHTWSGSGFGDGSATVGAVTINAPAGYATVAAGASSVAITCNLVTANTIARAFQVGGIDATLGAYIGSTVSGSVITLQFAANATANRKIFFELLLD
jgi:hypothetical protein